MTIERTQGTNSNPYAFFRECDKNVSCKMTASVFDEAKSVGKFATKALLSIPIGLAGLSVDFMDGVKDDLNEFKMPVAEAAGLDSREKPAPQKGESAFKTLMQRLWKNDK